MTLVSIFNLAAIVVTLAALFGYVNHRWLRLPHTIGIVIIALGVSFSALILDRLFPGLRFENSIREILLQIDFHEALMKCMLSFLLFAGAMHVDLGGLLSRKWAIFVDGHGWHPDLDRAYWWGDVFDATCHWF